MVDSYETNYELPKQISMPDKVTSTTDIAFSYELVMRGYSYFPSDNKWKITGKALAGSDFIRKTTGILMTYCEKANLITTKNIEKFSREAFDAFHRVNPMCVNDNSIAGDDYRSIIKIFKDRLSAIGDIITGSRVLVSKSFNDTNREIGENEY